MKVEIKHRWSGAVLYTADVPDDTPSGLQMRVALEKATAARANLSGAYLAGAYLADAYLADANLSDANLSGAYLAGAYLADANLAGANLSDANLSDAYLAGANLRFANLSGANLRFANLSDAYLAGAYLADANLAGANLSDANLRFANLSGANLRFAKSADYAIAMTRILPEGDLIGWKKCKGGVIVKLRIPADAKRSNAFGRKCRAEFADVLEVIGAEVGIASHDGKTEYRAGQRVQPGSFSDDWMTECAPGIHFFITRLEAENY